jgi:hypothetical protein
MHMTVIWNVNSTYVPPIFGQSMIIWHMTNLLAGVSTIASIVQYVWKTDAFKMEHGKKVSFFDCHWRFLPSNHPFRSDRRSFLKGKTVRKGPPKWKLGANITKILDDLKESENGEFEGYGEKHNWTHKSCLWELPCAKALILSHNIN